jgi:NADPH:quinone reductase
MKMRAVGYFDCLPVDDPNSLIDVEINRRPPAGRDLLVENRAISVNPVDVKQRARQAPIGSPRILGFDGAGIVVAAASDARLFRPGDEVEVSYAGSIVRSGTTPSLTWWTSASSAARRATSPSPKRRRCL